MKGCLAILQAVCFILALTCRAEGPSPSGIDEASKPPPARNPYPYSFFHPQEPFYSPPQTAFSDLSPLFQSYPISYPAYPWIPTSAWIPNQSMWPWPYYSGIYGNYLWYPGAVYILCPLTAPCATSSKNTIYLGRGISISWR